jgi:hypothetical protein
VSHEDSLSPRRPSLSSTKTVRDAIEGETVKKALGL